MATLPKSQRICSVASEGLSQRLVSLTPCTTHCQKADFSAGGGQKVYSSTVAQ